MVRALHTSDWHLGSQLYEKDRLEEQKQFLAWLTKTIAEEKIGVLAVAGDIFDNHAPSVAAQTLYFEFLAGLLELGQARPEIFIIAGNHDSPQFLSAPREILSHLRIHIVSAAEPLRPEGEVFAIRDAKGNPLLAVCAVPFLRERDLRLISDLGSGDDPAAAYREAAAGHFRAAVDLAKRSMPELPVLVMGHLFLGGAVLSDDTSERLREVGRLSSMPAEMLPPADYYALGHLHRPQCVRGMEHCRYSGSPLAMSFSEAGQTKSVTIVEFESASYQYDLFRGGGPRIICREVPGFSRLEQIRGNAETIRKRLEEIKAAETGRRGQAALTELTASTELTAPIGQETSALPPLFIEIQLIGSSGDVQDFWAEIDSLRSEALENRYSFSILAKQDLRDTGAAAAAADFTEIRALKPVDVFERKLDEEHIEGEKRDTFLTMFREAAEQVEAGNHED
ncbi:MAG: exonuclease subunit SbcD [Spirochaetaceae bacterium]|jgi:exonuclease SbcD|nr:exonuclease subunit SbcD [Spirochaetaceae bacterium]